RSDAVAPNDFIGCRVDDRKDVLVLEVDVNLAGYWVVLGHACFTVEMECIDDLVLLNIDNGLGLTALVGYVELVEWCSIGTAVRLRLGRQLLDDLHLFQVDDSDGVVPRIRCVKLLQLRNKFYTIYALQVR